MQLSHDLHTHSTYSDGWDLEEMVATAAEIGLQGLGIADHCPIGPDPFSRRERYDLAETYEARREELAHLDAKYDIAIYDAAEVNFDPAKAEEIGSFLAEAGFTYTIGSVHFVRDYDIVSPNLADAPIERRRDAVERYVEWQVALIESELFDIVGHLDLVQRDPALRGLIRAEDYERIADALVESRSLPELNAGRLDRAYGRTHPDPDRLAIFAERGIPFVVGSDAHAPDQLERRLGLLAEELDTFPVDLVRLPPAVR